MKVALNIIAGCLGALALMGFIGATQAKEGFEHRGIILGSVCLLGCAGAAIANFIVGLRLKSKVEDDKLPSSQPNQSFEVGCSYCAAVLDVPAELFGQAIQCPSCNGEIILPQAAPPPLPKAGNEGCPTSIDKAFSNDKDLLLAYLLCIFTGIFGGHRYYLSKWKSGLVYTFTCGLFFVGWAIDIFVLPKMVKESGWQWDNVWPFSERKMILYWLMCHPEYASPEDPHKFRDGYKPSFVGSVIVVQRDFALAQLRDPMPQDIECAEALRDRFLRAFRGAIDLDTIVWEILRGREFDSCIKAYHRSQEEDVLLPFWSYFPEGNYCGFLISNEQDGGHTFMDAELHALGMLEHTEEIFTILIQNGIFMRCERTGRARVDDSWSKVIEELLPQYLSADLVDQRLIRSRPGGFTVEVPEFLEAHDGFQENQIRNEKAYLLSVHDGSPFWSGFAVGQYNGFEILNLGYYKSHIERRLYAAELRQHQEEVFSKLEEKLVTLSGDKCRAEGSLEDAFKIVCLNYITEAKYTQSIATYNAMVEQEREEYERRAAEREAERRVEEQRRAEEATVAAQRKEREDFERAAEKKRWDQKKAAAAIGTAALVYHNMKKKQKEREEYNQRSREEIQKRWEEGKSKRLGR